MRLDLDFMQNKKCVQRCSKEKRQSATENDLCSTAYSEKDNLPVRCVGEWGQNKIYMLVQYFGIFAMGMKNKWEGQLNYIEICSGSGRCVTRNKGIEFDGTALTVVKNPAFKYINKALFRRFNLASEAVFYPLHTLIFTPALYYNANSILGIFLPT